MKDQITSAPKRIRRTPEQINEILDELELAGQSIEEFAKQRDIVLSTLRTWRRRYRPSNTRGEPRWVEVHHRVGLSAGTMAQVRLSDGLSIELYPGFDVTSLAGLIERLRKP